MIGYILGLGDRHMNNILMDMNTAEIVHIDLGIAFDAGLTLKTPELIPFRLTRDLIHGLGIYQTEGIYRQCAEKTMQVMRDNEEMLLTILQVFLYDPLHKWSLSSKKIQLNLVDDDDDDDDDNITITATKNTTTTTRDIIKENSVDQAGQAVANAIVQVTANVINNQQSSTMNSSSKNNKEESLVQANAKENISAQRAINRVQQKLRGREFAGGEQLSISGQVNALIREATDVNNLALLYCGWGAFC